MKDPIVRNFIVARRVSRLPGDSSLGVWPDGQGVDVVRPWNVEGVMSRVAGAQFPLELPEWGVLVTISRVHEKLELVLRLVDDNFDVVKEFLPHWLSTNHPEQSHHTFGWQEDENSIPRTPLVFPKPAVYFFELQVNGKTSAVFRTDAMQPGEPMPYGPWED